MNRFERNIISAYRDEGRRWLASLPKKVEEISKSWELDRLELFDDLSFNYVLSGYQKGKPIVLKLSPDATSLSKESKALQAFAGYGAVPVLEHERGALLLERAVPGNSLKTHFPKDPQVGIKIACDVAKKLHQAPLSQRDRFPHITEWLAILDRDWSIPEDVLQKARIFKNELLRITYPPFVLLHGDLHRGNILLNGDDWLVIDPKGVIGSPINEIWSFVEEPATDLPFISDYFHFKFEDVVKWYYVHLVLAACWQEEDGLDSKLFLDLAGSTQSLMPS